MDTEDIDAKRKSHRIWGWLLAVAGGLFTWLSGFLFIVFTSDGSTDISSILFIALCLAIGVLLLILGIRGITRKEKKKSKIISICGAIVVIAIKLSKGQQLEGYGTIMNIAYVIDHVELVITINPELLIVR